MESTYQNRKHGNAGKRILRGGLLLILALLVLSTVYFSDYYHCGRTAEEKLAGDDTVIVTAIDDGYMFDGPFEKQALIFYPGAKVDEASYAPLLYQLAKDWGDCFLVRMPLHMAIMKRDAAAAIQETYSYEKWYLAGHSLGGAAAAMFVNTHLSSVDGLILLASYSTKEIPDSVDCCTVYGEYDQVLNKKKYEEYRENLPDNSSEMIIDGGNHAQFGDYGRQKGDGEATITPQQQWNQTCEFIKTWTERKTVK